MGVRRGDRGRSSEDDSVAVATPRRSSLTRGDAVDRSVPKRAHQTGENVINWNAPRATRTFLTSESAPCCRPQTASRRDEAAPRGRAARRQRVPPPPRGGCRVRSGQTRRTRVLRGAGRRAHHSSALRWRRRRRRGSRRAGVARGVQPRHAGVRVPRGPVEGGDADCQGRGLQVHGRDVEGHVQVYMSRRRRWRPGFT